MVKDLDYYMGLNYRIEVVEDKEDGGYALRCPDLRGCITCADTIEEGFKMIEDAKKCWFAACLEDGVPIPEPTRIEDYSGQFKLRMPKSLHKTRVAPLRQCRYSKRALISNNNENVNELSERNRYEI